MTDRAQCSLHGSIRLSGTKSGRGLPVFSSRYSNHYYVPDVDPHFRIIQFVPFFNEEGYSIDYIGSQLDKVNYRIGEQAPVIFRLSENYHVIQSSFDVEFIEKYFEERRRWADDADEHDVIHDVRQVFENIWSGEYGKAFARLVGDDIKALFDEVYHQPPVRSAYWIKRFNLAVTHALEERRYELLQNDLRPIFDDWVSRFLLKSEPSHIQSMLEDNADRIMGSEERSSYYLAVARNRALNSDFAFLSNQNFKRNYLALAPLGYCMSYIRGVRIYGLSRKDGERMLTATTNMIRNSAGRGDYSKALLVATYAYGLHDLPSDLEKELWSLYREEARSLDDDINAGFNQVFRRWDEDDKWREYADDLITRLKRLNDLYRTISTRERVECERPHAPIIGPDTYREIQRYAETWKR